MSILSLIEASSVYNNKVTTITVTHKGKTETFDLTDGIIYNSQHDCLCAVVESYQFYQHYTAMDLERDFGFLPQSAAQSMVDLREVAVKLENLFTVDEIAELHSLL